jgi:hypothetical protein
LLERQALFFELSKTAASLSKDNTQRRTRRKKNAHIPPFRIPRDMRESRGGDALETSPPAANKRQKTSGASSSSPPAEPDDFCHCLIYNISLTDMVVSTQRVARANAHTPDSAEEARARMCRSLGRPKFSNQVRASIVVYPLSHIMRKKKRWKVPNVVGTDRDGNRRSSQAMFWTRPPAMSSLLLLHRPRLMAYRSPSPHPNAPALRSDVLHARENREHANTLNPTEKSRRGVGVRVERGRVGRRGRGPADGVVGV